MEFSEDEGEEQDDDDEDELNENYLQKLDNDVKQNIISDFHPELNTHSMEEVEASCTIIRDDKGVIVDPLHRTLPFVTRYEKARAIGERAKQINSGAKPFIEIDQSMIDGYLIALKEFEAKKIPFIIRRPLPNGTSEYWRLSDLEIIA
jgi:DNA-directed RNA polymerase I, II, and III subunit RPABC2